MHKCQVVDTTAFDCILGTDLLNSGRINGILLKPPRLVVNNQEYPLREEEGCHLHRLNRIFTTEDYKLRTDMRLAALRKMEIDPRQIKINLFATKNNAHEALFCTKNNSAWKYNWRNLMQEPNEFLWANPPFSKLTRALTKVAMDKCRIIMVTPDWGNSGQNGQWRRLLDRLTIRRVILPNEAIYEKFGDPA